MRTNLYPVLQRPSPAQSAQSATPLHRCLHRGGQCLWSSTESTPSPPAERCGWVKWCGGSGVCPALEYVCVCGVCGVCVCCCCGGCCWRHGTNNKKQQQQHAMPFVMQVQGGRQK